MFIPSKPRNKVRFRRPDSVKGGGPGCFMIANCSDLNSGVSVRPRIRFVAQGPMLVVYQLRRGTWGSPLSKPMILPRSLGSFLYRLAPALHPALASVSRFQTPRSAFRHVYYRRPTCVWLFDNGGHIEAGQRRLDLAPHDNRQVEKGGYGNITL